MKNLKFRKGTQIADIYNHLMTGRTITPLEALGLYGTFRLGGHIYNLKKKGCKIHTEIRQDLNGHIYAEYAMCG